MEKQKHDKSRETVYLPSICPMCRSRRRRQLGVILTQPIAGKLSDGTEFQQVTWLQVECVRCGQLYRVRQYEKQLTKPSMQNIE